MNEKALLRRDLSAWLGKKLSDAEAAKLDIFKMLGKTGMVNIAHVTKGENTYANIISFAPLMKGYECPAAINEAFTYTPTAHDQEVFSKLPEFIQDKIKESDEYIAMSRNEQKSAFNKPPQNIEELPDIDDIFGQKAANDLPWD
jgi:hypothetical protein